MNEYYVKINIKNKEYFGNFLAKDEKNLKNKIQIELNKFFKSDILKSYDYEIIKNGYCEKINKGMPYDIEECNYKIIPNIDKYNHLEYSIYKILKENERISCRICEGICTYEMAVYLVNCLGFVNGLCKER